MTLINQDIVQEILKSVNKPQFESADLLIVKYEKQITINEFNIPVEFAQYYLTLKKVQLHDNSFDWLPVALEIVDKEWKPILEYANVSKLKIVNNYNKIRHYLETDLEWSELVTIKSEICNCLINEDYQAAITLTNHLLEKCLKSALIYHECGIKPATNLKDLSDKYSAAVEKFSSKEMHTTINMACSKMLITKERKKILHKYRDLFRNAFSHGDAKALIGNHEGRFAMGSFKKEGLEISKIKFADVPFLQGIAQENIAKANAEPYFNIVMGTIKKMESNLNNLGS